MIPPGPSRPLPALLPGALLALALSACRSAPAPRPSATGCERSLAGTWHDSEDVSYSYRVEDAGEQVVAHPFVAGQGRPAADGPSVVIELSRRGGGLEGVVRQTGPFKFPDGTSRTCSVEFAARVLRCSERQLEIEVEQSGAIGPNCRRAADEAPDLARHVWLRE